MTDTTVAADTGGAPDTSVPVSNPAATEVPINPSPVSAPSPIGSQAPQAPADDVKGSPHHPKSARETIQEAYDRALNPPTKPQRQAPKEPPKAAEAKPGHNKPPEKTEPFNLKKPPAEQPRGDHGRFTPRQESAAGKLPLPATEGDGAAISSQPAPSPHPQLPHNAPYRDPPPRMDEAAKAEWHATPESVRGSMHRMHREFAQAYEQYRGAAEAFQPIAHYHQMAQQHGTTLQKALDNYTGMEAKLRSDVIAGLDLIVHNLGLTDDGTPNGQRIGLRDIAYHVLSQTPDQLRSLQQGNTVSATQHQLYALQQQQANMANAVQQIQYGLQYGQTRSAIDVFADDGKHPRFDELSAAIDQELNSGYDLETAYRRADLLYPATQAAQTRTASAQTRPPDRSISGAPGGSGSNGSQPSKRAEPRSIRDSVEHAARRVSNGY
jgi:hypothetical protein